MTALTKSAMINTLAQRYGYRDYLELCTPSSGRYYSSIDRSLFDHVRRMMYLSPFAFDDGALIDFRSPDEDLAGVITDFRTARCKMDIALVDGWHTYRTSSRDLVRMFRLLADGGMLIVHDCLPPSRETASPAFRRREWCGVAYKSYLDFVLQTEAFDYLTVDCDYGCGVIVKNRRFDALIGPDLSALVPDRPPEDLVQRWLAVGSDFDAAYDLFDTHKAKLLRLISPDQFQQMFGIQVPAVSNPAV